jgi:hypothetical protein
MSGSGVRDPESAACFRRLFLSPASGVRNPVSEIFYQNTSFCFCGKVETEKKMRLSLAGVCAAGLPNLLSSLEEFTFIAGVCTADASRTFCDPRKNSRSRNSLNEAADIIYTSSIQKTGWRSYE